MKDQEISNKEDLELVKKTLDGDKASLDFITMLDKY
jgi:hypothetical protein